MKIINIIDLQLREILKLLKEDLKNSNITYNYLICEAETKFLDSTSMKLYLTETKIENETLLQIICDNCVKIVELWNIDFEVLPDKKLKEHFFYSDESKDKLFSTDIDFHAIYLFVDKLQFFNTIYGKEAFVKNYEYKIVPIPEIVSNCINIYNFIKQSYPEINSDFTPEYYFNHYNKTKRFALQSVLKPYSKSDFKEFKINLENYLIRYRFIFDKINEIDKIEFKQDIIDHLKNVTNNQIHSKYNVLLIDAIERIENNFQLIKTSLIDIPKNIIPQPNEISKPKKLKKTLLEFFHNIENKEKFIQELKNLFPTEQGKSIKAIVLKLVEVQILIYGTKEFFQFYNELKTYFNRDIGTYQSINDVKTVDNETAQTVYKKLNPLIAKYKPN
ncbi:hypothetical protein M0M57_07825 [Flavobacterium azooxidireducens]|uniref:Uncharacterized protein n=1 Tax=Flavobacterium azooxidireducens TaxID=1871076 RepID=A0ABY4KIS1_9FLAO|nr:hypothetical protein [Flavobacterium azooxidireducens]UPQ80736.1 hypothetical protein M0M57_07825 [Flavobacterium azooxidireducens]